MAAINYMATGKTTQTDLCAVAILQTAAALQTEDGRAAVEKGRIAYLRHLAEKGKTK
jgi:hypothetical protein